VKTILLPTDFFEVSRKAINYAVELAKPLGAKLILFHAYLLLAITADVIVITPPLDEVEKFANENLKTIREDLQLKIGNALNVACKSAFGFAANEIENIIKQNKINFVVIGMHGFGHLSEKLIGSATTSLMRKYKCPVFAIDQCVKFKAPKKIEWAVDYFATENKTYLQSIKEIATILKSHVYVLNIINGFEPAPNLEETNSGCAAIEEALAQTDFSLHYLMDNNEVDGINTFVSERKMDLIVMIPSKHSILENIFQKPNTKRMAFYTTVPVLTLHES